MQGRKNHIHPLVSPDSPENSFFPARKKAVRDKKVSEKTGHFVIFCFDDLNAVII